ncbi:MAG TPA: hypothetical protein VFM96_16085 [Gaiellaceae bacterium]|nr:hypothetical protein [Gaiellaceae bacterium]
MSAALPPSKTVTRLQAKVAALQAKVVKLTSQNKTLTQNNTAAQQVMGALGRRIVADGSCPITRANGNVPSTSLKGSGWHGQAPLWVQFLGVASVQANIVVGQAAADGSISTKFPWWRGVAGTLRVAGKRLDGAAPPLTASIAPVPDDTGIQPTKLSFPTAGCWQVTGQLGDASLTFVTLVLGL